MGHEHKKGYQTTVHSWIWKINLMLWAENSNVRSQQGLDQLRHFKKKKRKKKEDDIRSLTNSTTLLILSRAKMCLKNGSSQ